MNPDKRADVCIGPYRERKFWRNRKSRPLEARLQCHCKRGSSGEYRKKADSVVGPYRLPHHSPVRSNSGVYSLLAAEKSCV